MDISEKVKNIIVEQLGINAEQVVPGARFQQDLDADSLDQVELIMALEEEFKIEGPDTEAEKLTTVGAVVDYITSLVGNTALGQILVYRVFLRIPPELLQAEEFVMKKLARKSKVVLFLYK